MKTAEEILKTVTCNQMRELTFERAKQAMEEYANQFKYDYSQECKCGEDSIGSTWCCNLCGLPLTNKHKHRDGAISNIEYINENYKQEIKLPSEEEIDKQLKNSEPYFNYEQQLAYKGGIIWAIEEVKRRNGI